MADKKCTSCNSAVVNDEQAASLPCPKCSDETIIRCGKCRKTAVTYKCSKCNFKGP